MDITADAAGATGPQEIPGDPLALERQVCFALSIAARSVLSVYRPLLAAGLVTRTRDPADERQLRIDLTPKGRALREDALRIPPSIVAKLGMSLGDLEELHKGLTAVNEAARRAGVKPLPAPAKGSI